MLRTTVKKMGSKKQNSFLVQVFYFIVFMISSTQADEKKESWKMMINDFCNQRSTREDRLFCALVFQTRTTSIKENLGLLRVAVQFSLGNAMKTYREFLLNKETNNVAAVLLLIVITLKN